MRVNASSLVSTGTSLKGRFCDLSYILGEEYQAQNKPMGNQEESEVPREKGVVLLNERKYILMSVC